ncbi:hypothetical protein EDD86DRAFT_220970 [Gorgonomyces haynaldii]|nr:hypothetical protein EDD86DRAFT_220970 [Gorgonomyces haynaldii]
MNAESLQAMFPLIEPDVIQAVLAANDGDAERTLNQLLEMSDPKPQGNLTDEQLAQQLAQLQQDEQLAMELQMQENPQQPQEEEKDLGESLKEFGQTAKKSVLGFFEKVQQAFKQDKSPSPQYANLPGQNEFQGFLDDDEKPMCT